MDEVSSSQTSPTLLGRLRRDPTDQKAWSTFVERYAPRIYTWCRLWQLQEADAEDVTQTVLARLALKMRDFSYDPGGSFRGWLKTLAHHAWRDFVTSRRRGAAATGDSHVLQLLESVEARDDLVARLQQEFDQELLQEAMRRVQQRIAPAKWQTFHMMAVEGLSGAAVAEKLAMKVATVFVVRSKVQKMLQEEIRKLEGASS